MSGSTLIFVKNTHQKAANLMFCLISPVGMVPWRFLGAKFNCIQKRSLKVETRWGYLVGSRPSPC